MLLILINFAFMQERQSADVTRADDDAIATTSFRTYTTEEHEKMAADTVRMLGQMQPVTTKLMSQVRCALLLQIRQFAVLFLFSSAHIRKNLSVITEGVLFLYWSEIIKRLCQFTSSKSTSHSGGLS